MLFNPDLIACPACGSETLSVLKDSIQCKKCKKSYEIKGGIPVLLTDPSMFTHLEAIDYDKHHWIDASRKDRIFSDWDAIFSKQQIKFGDVLEIGAGTGQVTHVLAERFPFKHIHACDISHAFLDSIRLAAEPATASKLQYYVSDANYLPFRNKSFNLVVGNSVLHHFVDYDKCLKKIYDLLVPGGCGVFHEPVIQGKIWIAFFADLMIRIDRNAKMNVFDDEDREKAGRLIRHILKDKWADTQKERVKEMEDKYIFDISKMEKLSKEIGFSRMEFINNAEPDKGYRKHVIDHLLMAGIPGPKIEKFRFLNVAFAETFSSLLQHDIRTPMGYFVFIK